MYKFPYYHFEGERKTNNLVRNCLLRSKDFRKIGKLAEGKGYVWGFKEGSKDQFRPLSAAEELAIYDRKAPTEPRPPFITLYSDYVDEEKRKRS